MHVWRPKVDLLSFLDAFQPTHLFRGRTFCWSLKAYQWALRGSCLCPAQVTAPRCLIQLFTWLLGIRAQVLMLARQALYHWAVSPAQVFTFWSVLKNVTSRSETVLLFNRLGIREESEVTGIGGTESVPRGKTLRHKAERKQERQGARLWEELEGLEWEWKLACCGKAC